MEKVLNTIRTHRPMFNQAYVATACLLLFPQSLSGFAGWRVVPAILFVVFSLASILILYLDNQSDQELDYVQRKISRRFGSQGFHLMQVRRDIRYLGYILSYLRLGCLPIEASDRLDPLMKKHAMETYLVDHASMLELSCRIIEDYLQAYPPRRMKN